LRARTRITAWVIIILGTLIAFNSRTHLDSRDAALLVVVCLWIAVLAKQGWARIALPAMLLVQFSLDVHHGAGLAVAHDRIATFWLTMLIGAMSVYGWQAFVLLTEDTAKWRGNPRVSEEI
jgi:hypothetical protein